MLPLLQKNLKAFFFLHQQPFHVYLIFAMKYSSKTVCAAEVLAVKNTFFTGRVEQGRFQSVYEMTS